MLDCLRELARCGRMEHTPAPNHNSLHSQASSLREQYLEYGLLGQLCQEMWQRGMDMDILRSHTDRSGYDILLEANDVERHIQLKSSFVGAKTSTQKINVRLAAKPSGCVVWVRFNLDTFEIAEFLWFGSAPGESLPPLGDRIAKHTKGDKFGHKAERTNVRILNKGQFTKISSIPALADCLFGEISNVRGAETA